MLYFYHCIIMDLESVNKYDINTATKSVQENPEVCDFDASAVDILVFIYRDCSPGKQPRLHLHYQHFMLECRMTPADSYLIWVIHHTGCIVFQKTKKEEYHCHFNVIVKKGITSVKFSTSFKPVFAQKVYYNEYNIQLYTPEGLLSTRYGAVRDTRDIYALETKEWNCTKISIYEYESTSFIQTMFYQMKLGFQLVTYPQYTLSKHVTQLVSTALFAFVRMLVDVRVRLLLLHVEVVDPFQSKPMNIYYVSLNVTQCQTNSLGMILVLTAKEVYETITWYRDTYKFLAPATILPIIKVPHQYLDINMYYLNRQPVTCVVDIDYRYYQLPVSEESHFAPLVGGVCKYVVSNLLQLS